MPMRIKRIDALPVALPFRLAFGHHLKTRSRSLNLVVKVTLDDGTVGWGEGVPRDYVTGEDITSARSAVESQFAPRFAGRDLNDRQEVLSALTGEFNDLGLETRSQGAAYCALEIAILDAYARSFKQSLYEWFGPTHAEKVRYGAVIPFGSRRTFLAILSFYKLYGFKTVKLKVGRDIDEAVFRLRAIRKVMGEDAVIRVDANCAWNVLDTLRAADAFRPFRVVSYEQPLKGDDMEAMSRVTNAIPEDVIADESLATIKQAAELIDSKACDAFNLRLSKVGGILAARRMAKMAREAGIKCHLGAQVGESAIITAAGRLFALTSGPFENYEGSNNLFLLKHDLSIQNLTVAPGGVGSRLHGSGLGVNVNASAVKSLSALKAQELHAETALKVQLGS